MPQGKGKRKGKRKSNRKGPLCEISLLEVLEAINGHLNCNHPTSEAFYTRYGKMAQKLGVVNYITRLYLSEIKLIDC